MVPRGQVCHLAKESVVDTGGVLQEVVLVLPTDWENLIGLARKFLNLAIHNLSTLSKWDPFDNQDIVGGVSVDVCKVELRDSEGKQVFTANGR